MPHGPRRRSPLPAAAALAAAVVVAGLLAAAAALAAAPSAAAAEVSGGPAGFEVTTVAGGLEVPWSMDIAPDGRIFFTERGGRLWIIGADGSLPGEPALSIDAGIVEGGLLGVALGPSFPDEPHVYIYHTYREFFSVYNRVVRYTEDGGALRDPSVLVDRIPGGPVHDGGRIRFGPDGMLYATTGDAGNVRLSRDLGSTAGKILRIAPDGSVPADNPYPGSPVYSSGHRNPQGIDWHPATGALVASEHGPSGERGFGQDEINVIERGADYGWPDAAGDEAAEGTVAPAVHSGDETWAPSGASFYTSDAIPEFDGRLLVAALAGKRLLAVSFEEGPGGGMSVAGIEDHLAGEYGRLRDVVDGGDGSVYVLTSNRDGRGRAAEQDDRILRLVPAAAAAGAGGDPGPAGAEGGGARQGGEAGVAEDSAPARCGPGLEPVVKRADGSPACVRPATAAILVERGWAAEPPETG